jgi:hypothetical protein
MRKEFGIEYEDKFYFELLDKQPNYFTKNDSYIENLKEMQHYGLPTRMLDITSNPLVALYFCCAGTTEKNVDGEIIVYQVRHDEMKNSSSDRIQMKAALATLSNFDKKELKLALRRLENVFLKIDEKYHIHKERILEQRWYDYENTPEQYLRREFSFNDKDIEAFNYYQDHLETIRENISMKRLLHSIKKNGFPFDKILNPSELLEINFLNIRLDNPRIIRQYGAMIISGLLDDDEFTKVLKTKQYKNENGNKRRIFIVPSSRKSKIIQDLSMLQISESTLFPDIDHITSQMKEEWMKQTTRNKRTITKQKLMNYLVNDELMPID